MIDYAEFDNRMAMAGGGLTPFAERLAFAKTQGYDYYSEMLHKKHWEGLSSYVIIEWINNINQDIIVAGPSVIYTLKKMGVFRKTTKRAIKRKKKTGVKFCSCCGLNPVQPGFRYLCATCYRDNTDNIAVR